MGRGSGAGLGVATPWPRSSAPGTMGVGITGERSLSGERLAFEVAETFVTGIVHRDRIEERGVLFVRAVAGPHRA